MGRSPVLGALPKSLNGFIVSEVNSESEQVSCDERNDVNIMFYIVIIYCACRRGRNCLMRRRTRLPVAMFHVLVSHDILRIDVPLSHDCLTVKCCISIGTSCSDFETLTSSIEQSP